MRAFGSILLGTVYTIILVLVVQERNQRTFIPGVESVLGEHTLSPDVRMYYYPVVEMGYGYAKHASGIQKMGITITAQNGGKSLVLISKVDEINLHALQAFLQHKDDPTSQPFDAGFLETVFHQAHILKHTHHVLFEKIGRACQVRFQDGDGKDTCVSFVDAIAVCMILTNQQASTNVSQLHVFAHKDLFSREYWESLFTYTM